MAEVNYMASTSKADEFQEPSVVIIDPKFGNSSITSSEEMEPLKSNDRNTHPNRPSDALWRQQKLPAWQPILTADTVLPAFFLLGIAFIPVGIGLLISSNQVQEYIHDYTLCHQFDDKNAICSDKIGFGSKTKCICKENFTLTEDFKAPVYLYYGLSKYYQNHRRYVQSKDDKQLAGYELKLNKDQELDAQQLNSYCDPYKEEQSTSKPIAPCGAIANSLFNDTFKLFLKISETSLERIDLKETDIAWPTDKQIKFKNPESRFSKYAKPPNWDKMVDDLDPNNDDNNGYKNEHLIVWMRTAALPTFRKLWGRIDHDQIDIWRTSLPKGDYSLTIEYNYPVIFGDYKGEKRFIISNTSWLGGKNSFLGYAYIVVGTLCLILWIAFMVIFKKYSQKPKDMVDIGPKTPFQMNNYSSTKTS